MTAGDQKFSVTDVLLLTRQNHCGFKKKNTWERSTGKEWWTTWEYWEARLLRIKHMMPLLHLSFVFTLLPCALHGQTHKWTTPSLHLLARRDCCGLCPEERGKVEQSGHQELLQPRAGLQSAGKTLRSSGDKRDRAWRMERKSKRLHVEWKSSIYAILPHIAKSFWKGKRMSCVLESHQAFLFDNWNQNLTLHQAAVLQ